MSQIPSINFTYPQPENFDTANPEFDFFKNLSPENCFSPEVKFLKNVRISTNSVIFNYFKIFAESCIEKNYEKYRKGFRFFLKFIFPKFNFTRKRFLLITDEWSSNYYHWHIISLAKLTVLKEQNLLDDSLLFLPKKYQHYKFSLPSLEKFGIKKNQIVFLRRKSNIKVSELAFAKTPLQHPIIFQKIRETLLNLSEEIDLNLGNRIYISREKQILRFIENEKEVVDLLSRYGFKKIIAEHFSYDEQIAICSKIKYLVSPHGAGLTNILFMSKGTSVLEMASKPNPIKQVTDYYKLSAMLGIKYFYQECQIGEKSLVKDFHQSSLVVDLKKLEENLQLMFKND